MAPASDEGSSSGGDIPFKDKATKDRANGDVEEDGEDDDKEEGEEYAVEKIISHKFDRGGQLSYKVKWVGYDETTMEPEDNLIGCPEEMKTYFKQNGGKPAFDGKPGKGTPAGSGYTTTAKRRLSAPDSAQASPTPLQPTKGRKKVKTDDSDADGRTLQDTDTKRKFKAPVGSWEKDIVGVDTVERDSHDGELWAFIVWNNGHKSKHQTKVLNAKCPGRMLAFYEAHIVFNPSMPDAEGKHVVSDSKAATSPPMRAADDDLEDEDMADVKPVASAS